MTPDIIQMIAMNTTYITAYPDSDITFLVNMTHDGLLDVPINWSPHGLIQERNRAITTLDSVYEQLHILVETDFEDRLNQSKSKWWQKYEEHTFLHQSQVDSDYLPYLMSPEVKALEASSVGESLEIAGFSDTIWEEKEMLWLSSINDSTRLKLMNSQLTNSYRIWHR
jgi:hypothetical protein